MAIIGFMPTPGTNATILQPSNRYVTQLFVIPLGHGTIGSLDYPPEERKKLAKRSMTFQCEDCGTAPANLLKSKEDESAGLKSTAEEAKEIVMNFSLKGFFFFFFKIP